MSDLIRFSFCPPSDLGKAEPREDTWEGIAKLFAKPKEQAISEKAYRELSPNEKRKWKSKPGLIIGATFAKTRQPNGTMQRRRRSDQIEDRTIVNLDVDEHGHAIWRHVQAIGSVPGLEKFAHLYHTTRSHTEDEPRLRVMVPVSRPLEVHEYEPVARLIGAMIDKSMEPFAAESFTDAQGMYLPSLSEGQFYDMEWQGGDFVDVDKLLKRVDVDVADTWPRREGEAAIKQDHDRRMAHPEDKIESAPIITALSRVFTPEEFIEKYLNRYYVPARRGDRYSYKDATGAASVRVYDQHFVQSDHGSDPARGQHNIFDLGRIHLFRHHDKDYDTDAMSLVDVPSFKAMQEMVLNNPAVKEAYDQVLDEGEQLRLGRMASLFDDDEEEDDPVHDPEGVAAEFDDESDDGHEQPAPKEKLSFIKAVNKIKKGLRRSKDMEDFLDRCKKIAMLSLTDFSAIHREMLLTTVQEMFKLHMDGEKLTKPQANRLIQPLPENLRERLEGTEPPTWLKDWVFLAQDNKFYNLNTREAMTKDGFNGRLSNVVAKEIGATTLGMPKIAASDLALSIFNIPTPGSARYDPTKPPLYELNGVLYANSYAVPEIPSGDYSGREGVKLLRRLLQDLFPDEAHQSMVLDFLAHCVQKPGKRIGYALLIKGSQNEGKTLLAMLLAAMAGEGNHIIIGPDQLREKFNGWASENVACVVEEIKLPGFDAHDVLNRLKPVITNAKIPVRRMRTDVINLPNFTNMLMTTNFEDAIPMTDEETRILVLFTRFANRTQVRNWRNGLEKDEAGRDYLSILGDHIENRPLQFYTALKKYKFSEHYRLEERAPETVFKERMTLGSKSEEQMLMESLLVDESVRDITEKMTLWSAVRRELDHARMGNRIHNRTIGSFMRGLGFMQVTTVAVKMDGRLEPLSAWTKDDSIIDKDGKLTAEGRELAKSAIREYKGIGFDDESEEDEKDDDPSKYV